MQTKLLITINSELPEEEIKLTIQKIGKEISTHVYNSHTRVDVEKITEPNTEEYTTEQCCVSFSPYQNNKYRIEDLITGFIIKGWRVEHVSSIGNFSQLVVFERRVLIGKTYSEP